MAKKQVNRQETTSFAIRQRELNSKNRALFEKLAKLLADEDGVPISSVGKCYGAGILPEAIERITKIINTKTTIPKTVAKKTVAAITKKTVAVTPKKAPKKTTVAANVRVSVAEQGVVNLADAVAYWERSAARAAPTRRARA